MLGITHNKWVFLALANVLILFVGCFIDTIAAITILVPILLPIVLKLGIDPIHFGLIMTLNLMIGLLHPPLGMVLFVLARVAKLSVERTTMAILPWLVPLMLALIAITYIPELTLWLPKYMGLLQMTDPRLSPQPCSAPKICAWSSVRSTRSRSGMVRIRFGAGGICGSDMHYFRHARTGDFVVKSPLVLGHEIAGEVVEIAAPRAEPEGRRPCRRQSVALVRPLRRLPRGPAESLRKHLLHGLGLEDAAHAGRLRQSISTRSPRSASRSPITCPIRPRRWPSRSRSACMRWPAPATSRASAGIIFGAGPIGLLTMLAARRAGMAEVTVVDIAPAPLAFATRLGAYHVANISERREGLKAQAASRPTTSRSKSRARPRALPAPSASSGAAALWCRSAICRAARFRRRRMR